MTVKGDRQAWKTLADIRDDHRLRYEWAADYAREHGLTRVVDLGAGTGYGAYIMAERGARVRAYDISAEAVAFGNLHYAHPGVERVTADVKTLSIPDCDLVVAFEFLEHIHGAVRTLQAVGASHLLASVPNEHVSPHDPEKNSAHVRHYTEDQLWAMLEAAGWEVQAMGCQIDKRSPIRWDMTLGMTLVVEATRETS